MLVALALLAGCSGARQVHTVMRSRCDAGPSGPHRPEPVTCPGAPSNFKPPGPQALSNDLSAPLRCGADSECTVHAGGHCTSRGAFFSFPTCVYDECYEDAHCGQTQVCECGGRGVDWNRCVEAGCHVDADCGSGRRCVPAPNSQCGPAYPLQGYFCQAPDDECACDSDCGSKGAYCRYDGKRWRCSQMLCAGGSG